MAASRRPIETGLDSRNHGVATGCIKRFAGGIFQITRQDEGDHKGQNRNRQAPQQIPE